MNYEKIRLQRINSGVTLKELSKETGIDSGYLSKLETGKLPNVSIKTLERVCDSLELKLIVKII
jgi:DNA-binding Xre family transcriptional regulator